MSGELRALGIGVYAACVDFMINLAALLGMTYRDTNALVLLAFMPLVTIALCLVALWQRSVLRRLRSLR